MMAAAGVAPEGTGAIIEFMDRPPDKASEELAKNAESDEHSEKLLRLIDSLSAMGASDYISLDFNIVRGLAYYTGIVYEAIVPGERAMAGGGRYDGLLEVVGGAPVGATGFGMGDVVLGIILQENGLLPEGLSAASLDYYVIDADGGSRKQTLELVDRLREKGISADYSMRAAKTGKQMKEADRRNARFCALVEAGAVSVKDMSSGEQSAKESFEDFISRIGKGR
jgi:histidyl-tRNA synthetase